MSGQADDGCRCTMIKGATLQEPAEWEQAENCPVHPRLDSSLGPLVINVPEMPPLSLSDQQGIEMAQQRAKDSFNAYAASRRGEFIPKRLQRTAETFHRVKETLAIHWLIDSSPGRSARCACGQWQYEDESNQTHSEHLAMMLLVAMQGEAARLSRLLFEAREQIDMWGDVVGSQAGQRDTHTDAVRDEIDAYRAERGWSPDGFGGEH